jgi:hypothetical protein
MKPDEPAKWFCHEIQNLNTGVTNEDVRAIAVNARGYVFAGVEGFLPSGMHKVEWNAKGLPSGVYFYRLQAGKLRQSMKMLVLK